MTGRLRRLGAVAILPTLVDVGLLVFFRRGLGWILVISDLAAITVASAVSYVLHRFVTFRSDPYVRWVQVPAAFVAVAVAAALVDVVVLRALYAGAGFTSTGALIAAKCVALLAAAAVRLIGYRGVLLAELTRARRVRVERRGPPGDRRFSVVVPAFREADRIGATVRCIREALAEVDSRGGLEVVVVDDGSTDGTADAALAAGADQVIVQPDNRGKGAAVRAGMLAARGRTVAFTDADLAYSPGQLLRILAAVEDGWDAVIGNRRHPEATTVGATSSVRAWGSRAINVAGYLVLLGSFRDTQCGLKGFRSDVARFVFSRSRVDGFAFDIEILHLIERHELSVAEIPVRVENTARSTVQAARDAGRLVSDLFRIRHWSAIGAYEADGRESELASLPEAPTVGHAIAE